MDLRQTEKYGKYLKTIGWDTERLKGNVYSIKKIPFLGTFIKLQRPDNYSIKDINTYVKKTHPSAIIVEPINDDEALLQNGFLHHHPYVPSKTVIIDIKKSEELLLKECKKHTRQAIKKTQKLMLLKNPNISLFREKWIKASKGQRYIPNNKKLTDFVSTFGSDCVTFMDPSGHAGALFVSSDDTVYYWHGFTDEVGRKELTQYQIIWQGILWGKNRKKKFFDMEGIYDTRFPIKGWEGFSHFKKSFGGEEKSYPEAYIKYFGLMNFFRVI